MLFYFAAPTPPFFLPHSPDPQEQVQQQQERIEELEEALRESVRITAQREIAVAERQALVEAADEKVTLNGFYALAYYKSYALFFHASCTA